MSLQDNEDEMSLQGEEHHDDNQEQEEDFTEVVEPSFSVLLELPPNVQRVLFATRQNYVDYYKLKFLSCEDTENNDNIEMYKDQFNYHNVFKSLNTNIPCYHDWEESNEHTQNRIFSIAAFSSSPNLNEFCVIFLVGMA